MGNKSDRIQVTCPSCGSDLTVDPKTGLVLHSQDKKPDYSLDEAIEKERARKEKSDQLFQDAFSKEKERRASLEEKFREALDSKDELDEPTRPRDYD